MLVRNSRALELLAQLPALLILPMLALQIGCNDSASKSQSGKAAKAAPNPPSSPSPLNAPNPSTAANPPNAGPPSFLHYPRTGDAVEPWIQEQVELAEAAHARVLVYVGASWCEPCQRFHQAVEHGELNDTLNGLRFLEFDQDQDATALKNAGYVYQYIPVLALPDPDGRNHGKMISGSIKGPRAVRENLVPRLQELLSGQAVD